MKVTESFVIDEAAPTLWEFFEQVDRVARCVPGVEHVEVLDDANSRLRIAQAIGPMSTTLDMRMQITERVPGSSLSFTATGRSVKGAVGHVRATNVIELSEEGPDSTRVSLAADIALGGMIGSVGQKTVAKQARKISQAFADSLQRELTGGATPEPQKPTPEPEKPAPEAVVASTPTPEPARVDSDAVPAHPASGAAVGRSIGTHIVAAAVGALGFAALSAWARRRNS